MALKRSSGRGRLFSGVGGGLGFDPVVARRALARADAELGALMRAVGPFGLEPDGISDPFASLAESIVYQQLTGKAAATIFGRVQAIYAPARRLAPRAVLDTDDARLRAAGLSRGKTAALKDLAAKALDGTVPTIRELGRMGDDEIVERLTAVRGIGRWTVEMMLIFRLGRPDVMPATDYGVRKGYARVFRKRKLPEPRAILAHSERWRPFRTMASWYLWRANELDEIPFGR